MKLNAKEEPSEASRDATDEVVPFEPEESTNEEDEEGSEFPICGAS